MIESRTANIGDYIQRHYELKPHFLIHQNSREAAETFLGCIMVLSDKERLELAKLIIPQKYTIVETLQDDTR